MLQPKSTRKTVFGDLGLKGNIEELKETLRRLYREDSDPWVIGYSGGKDSTAITQLAWLAIADLPKEDRKKPIYVVTTDTLVENPIVAAWVEQSLLQMQIEAEKHEMPFRPNLLRPAVQDTFWVNLVGKGYPSPRQKFRWCTDRLKIKPTNLFIENKVSVHGEVILFLGARSAESSQRASVLKKRASLGVESFGLTPHPNLSGCMVYTPIEDWTNDDVWQFLLSVPNPWGYDNKQLMAMYRGATADNECPVVVDTSTPSCGSSRFGCWVCTLVDEDKSMSAMIRNDHEKEWMLPLLELRNDLDHRGEDRRRIDRERRDFRRLSGRLSSYRDQNDDVQLVPGPYTQQARADWLRKILIAQREIRTHPATPDAVRTIRLISIDELHEIRRIWVDDKHEIEDLLPQLYESTTGEPFPYGDASRALPFGHDHLRILREECGDDDLQYELARNLIDIEWRYRLKGRRIGLFEDLTDSIESCFFINEEDALAFKRQEVEAKGITITIEGEDLGRSDHSEHTKPLFEQGAVK